MAFKLKRRRAKRKKKLSKKELLLRKIALAKKKLKPKSVKVKSKKLNNKGQNEPISISINITNDINTGQLSREVDWSTPDHYKSAAGSYRKGMIDNRKY